MSNNESWEPIVGCDGYQVSTHGRVRSRYRIVGQGDVNGCRRVVIRGKTLLVHLLVLRTFVGPRPAGASPRWLNGDPTDNRLVNLKWWTGSELEILTRVNRCRNDHVYSRENTRLWGSGHRVCLDCEKGTPRVRVLPEVL